MELFVNIIIDGKPLNIITKSFILDLWLGFRMRLGISKVKCNPKAKFTFKQILQERRGFLQKYVKNGQAK